MPLLHQIIPYVLGTIFQEEYKKLAMAIHDKIRDEKIQYDINWETVMNLFKKCTARPYYFLVIDTSLAPDNHLRVRYNLSERL